MALFKFQKISRVIRYSAAHKKFILSIPQNYLDSWDGKLVDLISSGQLPSDAVLIRDEVKIKIKQKLLAIQELHCIYCGLHFDIVGTAQRDHIASKSRYPQFTFTIQNIALACQYCNGFEKKSNKNTISKLNSVYRECDFLIVHPYFDDIKDHVGLSFEGANVSLSPKGNSVKGKNTIEIFGLNRLKQAELRGAAYIRNRLTARLTVAGLSRSKSIILRKYSA